MPKGRIAEDLTGKLFGRLTVIERAPDRLLPSGQKKIMWKCRCECGNIVAVPALNLKAGTKSCGCLQRELQRNKTPNLTGQRFGKLTVIERAPNKKIKKYCELAMWKCLCECGNIVITSGADLRNGHTKSCGCLQRDKARGSHLVHGMARSKLYSIWNEMKNRCKNPNDKRFFRYGGRGISVSEEFQSFENFRDWALSHGYEEGKSLDRINNDGNYSPENCQWLTLSEHGLKTWEDRRK